MLTITSLLKAAPASAVTMWTYERVLRILLDMEATANAAAG
jgi:solute carrier family 25 thiamine pyrophosphate transporter 19